MAEYLDKNESVNESYLQNWYIDSVDEAGTPHWTEEHIEELVNDFIVIPIETPSADVEPVVHAEWKEITTHNGCTPDYDCVCSNCKESGLPSYKRCPNCGARMD